MDSELTAVCCCALTYGDLSADVTLDDLRDGEPEHGTDIRLDGVVYKNTLAKPESVPLYQ